MQPVTPARVRGDLADRDVLLHRLHRGAADGLAVVAIGDDPLDERRRRQPVQHRELRLTDHWLVERVLQADRARLVLDADSGRAAPLPGVVGEVPVVRLDVAVLVEDELEVDRGGSCRP